MSGTVGTKIVPLFPVVNRPYPFSDALQRAGKDSVALASTEGLSEALLLRRLGVTVIAGQRGARATLPKSDMRDGQGSKGGRVMLRLRPSKIQASRALSESEGYSGQVWIARQLRYRPEGGAAVRHRETVRPT